MVARCSVSFPVNLAGNLWRALCRVVKLTSGLLNKNAVLNKEY